jgi:hypothetical protein
MQINSPDTTRRMTKGAPSKPSTGGTRGGSGNKASNPFPGGNWPSKVPGGKSGGNRGQGSKA